MTKTVVPVTHTYNKDSMTPVITGGGPHYLDCNFTVYRQNYLLDRTTVCECNTEDEAWEFIRDYKRLITLEPGDVFVLADHKERTEEVVE